MNLVHVGEADSKIRADDCSGVVPTGVKPSVSNFCCASGIAMILTISRWSLFAMSFGVPGARQIAVVRSARRDCEI